MSLRNRIGAIAILGAQLGGVGLASAPGASAHASFVSSDPADGAVLADAPAAIAIGFTEPPDLSLSQIRVVDGSGQPVEVGPLEREGRTGVRTMLPDPLPDGSYTVTWFVVSTVDGHLTTDAFAFGVGDVDVATTDTAPSTPGPDAAGVAGRALLYVGLALLVALPVVGGWAFGGRLRAIRPVAVAAALGAALGAALLVASEISLVGASTGAFLGSDTGRSFVVLLVAIAATTALAIVSAARTNMVTLALVGLGAVAAWAARAASGHPDGVGQTLGQTLHATAIGIWIGGLVLLLLLLRERRGASPPAAEVRRYSTLALAAVIVVLATGSVRALQELGGVGAVVDALGTGYGQVLAIKVGLAFVLVGFGALNRRRSIPRIEAGDRRMLGRVVRTEVTLAVGIAALTGTLTSLPPGGLEAPPAAPAGAIRDDGSDFGTTIRVVLSASPGVAGPNTFDATVTDFDTGEPADIDAVTLRLEHVGSGATTPATVELARGGDRWTARDTGLSIAGTWNVTVRIRSGAQTVDVPLVLTTRVPGTTETVAEVAGQPPITTVAYRDGTSAQLYVDPGAPGTNQVHLTLFDAAGQELPLDDATLAVVPPAEPARSADVLRFGPGHFVTNLELEDGRWTFDFTAVPVDGAPLQAILTTTIGD